MVLSQVGQPGRVLRSLFWPVAFSGPAGGWHLRHAHDVVPDRQHNLGDRLGDRCHLQWRGERLELADRRCADLKRRDDPFYADIGQRCLHICSDRDLEIRVGLDLDYVERAEEAEFILNTGPAGWDDTIEDYAPILAVGRERGLKMVCANPDLMVNHGAKLALCAGALAVHYEGIGGAVRWHGRASPNPNIPKGRAEAQL